MEISIESFMFQFKVVVQQKNNQNDFIDVLIDRKIYRYYKSEEWKI